VRRLWRRENALTSSLWLVAIVLAGVVLAIR
jgi:hypothetical protein